MHEQDITSVITCVHILAYLIYTSLTYGTGSSFNLCVLFLEYVSKCKQEHLASYLECISAGAFSLSTLPMKPSSETSSSYG